MKYLSKTAHKNSEWNYVEYRLHGEKCGLPEALALVCKYFPGADSAAGCVAS